MKNKKKPSHSIIENILFFEKLHWKSSKLSVLCFISSIPLHLGITILLVFLPKVIVENIISDHSLKAMMTQVLIIGAALILLGLFKTILENMNYAEVVRYSRHVMHLKIEKTLVTDYENIESPDCRQLLQRTDDALWSTGNDSVIERIPRSLSELVENVLGFLFFSFVISSANPWLLIPLTLTPVIHYLVIRRVQSYVYRTREETTTLDRKLWYIAYQSASFSCAKDVRVYEMHRWLISLYNRYKMERFAWDKKYMARYFQTFLLDALIIFLRDGLVYTILIFMAVNQQITLDAFVLYFASVGTFAQWVSGIIDKSIGLNDVSMRSCDVRDFLDYAEPQMERPVVTQVEIPKDQALSIELDHVSFRYAQSEKDTLHDITLTIRPGEKIAVVGPNGAGKTTLIKNICGLYEATSGTVRINGHDKKEFGINQYYSLFTPVFQDFTILPLTIAQFITCSNRPYDSKKMEFAVKGADLADKISTLKDGMDTFLNKQVNEEGIDLSIGEQQKLLLARALYKDAPILVLDEPTASLDPIAENKLYISYNELTKDKTSIFISHRLSSTRFCDRILFMQDGQITEEGSHEELMLLNKEYAHLYKVQSQYYQNSSSEVDS